MLIEEFDPALVYAFRYLFTHLMRTPTLYHVQSCPTILRLGPGRSAYEERVLELSLEVVPFDMVGEGGGYLPTGLVR